MYSCGPPHMDVQEWDDQHEHTYSNYVRTQDVTLKTCRRRWMIGRNCERGSRISALAARHDDDDDNRNILSTYFLVDPFILPYWFYSIRRELIDIFSIIVYFQSTFCPTSGHHQGRIYCQSDAIFVCTLLLCRKKSVWAIPVCSVYF